MIPDPFQMLLGLLVLYANDIGVAWYRFLARVFRLMARSMVHIGGALENSTGIRRLALMLAMRFLFAIGKPLKAMAR